MGKTGGGLGTNQYKTKGRSAVRTIDAPSAPQLFGQLVDNIAVPAKILKAISKSEQYKDTDFSYHNPPEIQYLIDAAGTTKSVDVLELLSQNAQKKIRRAVAENKKCPPEIVARLVKDPNEAWVGRFAARNQNCPVEVMEQIAEHGSLALREMLAMNKSLPEHLHIRLAQDRSTWDSLANRRILARQVQIKIATDGTNAQRKQLIRKKDTCQQALEIALQEGDYNVKKLCVRRSILSVEQLDELARDSHFKVREAIAESLDTGAHTLEWLANDESPSVRWEVIRNPNTPSSAIAKLFHDDDLLVREAAATHPNMPDHLKVLLRV